MDRRLKGAVDETGQFGKKPVVSYHPLSLQDTEDHPEKAVDGRCYRVEDKKHKDFWKGHIPPHVILHANCHEVNHVQEGGCVVRDEHNQGILHEPSE